MLEIYGSNSNNKITEIKFQTGKCPTPRRAELLLSLKGHLLIPTIILSVGSA